MSSDENVSGGESSPDSGNGNCKDDNVNFFEPKPRQQSKVIRVLTVLAYILSVSMAAILLSIYYVFMWEGKPHAGARRSHADVYGKLENLVDEGAAGNASLELEGLYEYVALNISERSNYSIEFEEKQLQISSLESEQLILPTDVTTTEQEVVTFSDYDNISSEVDELDKGGTFLKKLMFYNKYPYSEND